MMCLKCFQTVITYLFFILALNLFPVLSSQVKLKKNTETGEVWEVVSRRETEETLTLPFTLTQVDKCDHVFIHRQLSSNSLGFYLMFVTIDPSLETMHGILKVFKGSAAQHHALCNEGADTASAV